MVEQSIWTQKVEDPSHSSWYVERFRALAREGNDLVGEARLIDTMASRGSRILDAGCGPGRVGGYLAEVGHDAVGVDVDPVLIQAAEDHPGPRWPVNDLADSTSVDACRVRSNDRHRRCRGMTPKLSPIRAAVPVGEVRSLSEGLAEVIPG